MRLSLVTVISLLATHAWAIFADEAWTVDYQYALIGEPQEHTTFFHQPNPQFPATLLYTLSPQGVIGALNPKDGVVVWRQLLSGSSHIESSVFLRSSKDQESVISAHNSSVAAWGAADGRQAWIIPQIGFVEDLEIVEIPESQQLPGANDALVLTSGKGASVYRIDGANGAVKWQHKIDGNDTPYQVSASPTQVFAITLHKTMLGYIKIRVVVLEPLNGRKLDEITLNSESELSSAETIITVGANSASPIIAWTDTARSVLKINIIGTKSIQSFDIQKHDEHTIDNVRLYAPYHSNSLSHFLVHYQTAESHWADVFHVDLKSSKIEKAYSLPKLAGRGTFAVTTSDANVYFTRVTQDQIITVSSASHGVLGKWDIHSLEIARGPNEQVSPIHAVTELSIRNTDVTAIRTAILLSTGDWIMLREGSIVWQRPEALANTVAAAFATSPKVEELTNQLKIEADSNIISAYTRRLARHIAEIQYVPVALSLLPIRLARAILGTKAEGDVDLDIFGFHKIIACATKSGRVIAIDAGQPDRIVWNRKIVSVTQQAPWQPRFHESSDSSILSLTSGPGLPNIMINASNGDIEGGELSTDQSQHGQPDEITDVHYTIQNGQLEAHVTGKTTQSLQPLWIFKPAGDNRLLKIVPRPVNDPVASIGKVLGDRRVLYKYLDPNLAVVVTVSDKLRTATFDVISTVSGAILHSASHTGVDLGAHISAIISENWFVYTFTAEPSERATKGHYLVVGELFESLTPNDRGSLASFSNFSNFQPGEHPFTLVQTYQIPESVSKLAVTQTKQGITSRQLLAVLEDSHSIVGIPYGAIDPRRPVGRDATTDEQMEGLMRYHPVLDFNPSWSLNHKRELLGITDIVTSPALLESTSIVFAYGLDIFGTRLSPSFSFDILGGGFNKFQMLATVAGLAVGTLVVAPLVMRKQVNMRWSLT